ncbi:MAG: esterase/lipase family protein [Halothiobacillaceae bacterium]
MQTSAAGLPAVVLVHGLWYGPVSLALMARRLASRGFRPHRFSYPTLRQSLAANARALFDYARGLEQDQLHFVGHSLGGLVILRMFDEWTGLPPGRIVLLGSPVQGSAAAGRIAELKVTRPVIGKARTALEYGFCHAPAGHDTGIVAGTRSMGLGRIFEKLPLPHDGTIAVAETRLPGAADTIEVPVSHTGLVMSAEVVSAIERFLRRGRFGRDA